MAIDHQESLHFVYKTNSVPLVSEISVRYRRFSSPRKALKRTHVLAEKRYLKAEHIHEQLIGKSLEKQIGVATVERRERDKTHKEKSRGGENISAESTNYVALIKSR
ncbi:hypothetical protein N7499_012052 [Penicillium canescens]|nr:hypothetical protein N7522_011601 [Penicillium canescens]KAJ6049348.1 hypothetical protein N7444_006064 [Penicillium canescens]KAJ6070165.1 hypothetical protein N7499_012052 [Penicillium canescens]KAJ6181784.1 hypothetical protein N7485_000426 [Penicillium canescens]